MGAPYLTRFWSDVGNAALNVQFSCEANRTANLLFNNSAPFSTTVTLAVLHPSCYSQQVVAISGNGMLSGQFASFNELC
jgi:hypothetical protein